MAPALEDLKLRVAHATRVLADVGLATRVTSALGYASMCVPCQPDRFVVKGREYVLDTWAVMRAEDMVVCNTEGDLVAAPLVLVIPPAWLALTSVPGKSNVL